MDVISSDGWEGTGDCGTAVCNRTASNVAMMRMASLLCLVLVVFALAPSERALSETLANDPNEAAITEEPPTPELSRDAWRARIEEARRRAKEIALDRRLHPERYAPPPPEDPAKIASERVLRDDSLQPGDIVSTSRGMFVFRGRPDQPRGEGDFVALPAR